MAAKSEAEENYDLVTRNLQEVLGTDALKSLMEKGSPNIYWGTATTGRPHIAYFVPMIKIADFLRAGCKVTILFADLHAYLDNMKAPWDLLKLRTEYYEQVIRSMLLSLGVSTEKLRFVRGTDFELSREYTLDMYRLTSLISQRDAKRAGAEVVKQAEHPPLGGLLYPLLQALDEQYLGCDIQFGGVDQRKIFVMAEKYLPKIGYKKRVHLMNPMVPGLTGDKMSASEINSKIDLLDNAKTVRNKINRAFLLPPEEENWESTSGVFAFAKMVIFPHLNGKPFLINRPEKWGGPISFASYDALRTAYAEGTLAPGDLKTGVAAAVNGLLDPIRKKFQSKELRELTYQAYPEFAPKKSQPKKGNAAPRAADVSVLNILVGKIVSAKKHEGADTLLVEQIDLGEAEPRTVVSGIAKHFPDPSVLVGRMVAVVANMKPGNVRGVRSFAMVLCASLGDKLELVEPPAGAQVGERVQFEGFQDEPLPVLQPKKKYFEKVSPNFAVTANHVCVLKHNNEEIEFKTSAGPCTVASLGSEANIR